MINRSMIVVAALFGMAGFASTPSSAQQLRIWSSPGLGSEQFAPRYQQRQVIPMRRRVFFGEVQQERRVVWVDACGLFCQVVRALDGQ
jgi:hypothetical protein